MSNMFFSYIVCAVIMVCFYSLHGISIYGYSFIGWEVCSLFFSSSYWIFYILYFECVNYII